MNSNIKRVLVALLTTITAICLMMFTAMNFGGNVFADQTYIPVEFTSTTEFDFAMQDGASVKVAGFKNDKVEVERALRFTTKLNKNNLPEGEGVRVVTIITLTDLLKEAGLNDSKFTVENLKGLNVKYSSVIFSSENGNLTSVEKDGYYVYNACLYNIQDKNYTKEFSARSYVTNSEGQITQYTTYTYNPETLDNAGALWEVANAHKENIVDDEENTAFGPNADMTEKAYVSSLCQTYTVTAKGFDNATSDFTVKHGQTIKDVIDYDTLKTALNVAGCAYVNGTITEGDDSVEITKNTAITLGMNALRIRERTTDGVPNGTYEVAKGTLTVEDTTVIKVPSTYNGKNVVEVSTDGFKNATWVKKVILPDTITSTGTGAFSGCTGLTYLHARGIAALNRSPQFENCDSLKTIVVGRRVFIGTGFTSDVASGVVDIYYDQTYDNGSATLNIASAGNLISKHVFKYSPTDQAGAFTYDKDGFAVAYDIDSYFTYTTTDAYTAPSDAELLVYTEYGSGYQIEPSLSFSKKIVETGGVLEVPATYNGKPVVYVKASAFNRDGAWCKYGGGNSGLKKVILPSSVTAMGNQAFRYCANLTYFDAQGLTNFKAYAAMYGCSKLETLVLGKGCTQIGNSTIKDPLQGGSATCSIYFKGTVDEFNMTIRSDQNILNFKVYVYDETENAPYAWRFVDGVAKAYDDTSYYTYDTSNNILTEPTA